MPSVLGMGAMQAPLTGHWGQDPHLQPVGAEMKLLYKAQFQHVCSWQSFCMGDAARKRMYLHSESRTPSQPQRRRRTFPSTHPQSSS